MQDGLKLYQDHFKTILTVYSIRFRKMYILNFSHLLKKISDFSY